MRITHVITRLIVGGAQENTIATVLGLAEKPDVSVDLITGPSPGREGCLEWMFQERPKLLRIMPELVRPIRPWIDWNATRKLAALFRSERPLIVHTHSSKAGILGRIAARIARVPIIIHTIHGPSFGGFQGPMANLSFVLAEKIAARCTTHFITVAQAMTDQYLAAGIGRPEQFTRVFSGFNLDPFVQAPNDPELRRKFQIAPTDFVVGKIARFFELKGHDDLFQAAPALIQKVPNIKFLFVGDGPWRARFDQLIADRGWQKHFALTGLVPPHEVPKFVGIMDALVHLSRREGLPRALPQGMAAAKPVIAYDCDGAREVCITGRTGFLLAPGDVAGLIEKLSFLAAQPAARQQLGLEGQRLVQELFPVQKMVDDIHSLCLRLAHP